MRASLRHPEFRRYWAGSIASYIGHWMGFFTLGWLVVQLAAADGRPGLAPLYIGLVGLATAVPMITLTLFAGTIADRTNLRTVMIGTQLVLIGSSFTLAMLTISGAVTIGHVLALAVANAAALAFDQPSRQSILLRLVERSELMSAFGLYQSTYTVAQSIGPAIAGLLLVPLGAGGVILFQSLGHAIMAVTIASLPSFPPSPRSGKSFLGSTGEGIRFVLASRPLRWTVAYNGIVSFLARPYHYLVPALAVGVLGLGALELSWIVSAVGIGAMTGAVVVANLDGSPHRSLLVFASTCAAGAALIGAGTVSGLVPALLVSFAFGFNLILFGGLTGSTIQLESPVELRARITSIYTLFLTGAIPLGQMLLGSLAATLGLRTVFVGAGCIVLAAGVFGVARLRSLYPPTHDPAVASVASSAPTAE